MSLQQAQATQSFAGVGAGVARSIQGFREAMAARRAFADQADFVEANAEAEAEALIQAAEQRFQAFTGRATERRLEAARLEEFGEARSAEIRRGGRLAVDAIKAHAAARGIRAVGSPLEVAAEAAFVAEQQAHQLERDVAIQADAALYDAHQLQTIGLSELSAATEQSRQTILTANIQSDQLRSRRPSILGTTLDALDPVQRLTPGRIATLHRDFNILFPDKQEPLEDRLGFDDNFDEMLRGEL